VPFAPITEVQERLRRDLLTGDAPETLLLLEHHPVITLGRSAEPAHVLAAAPELARRGVALQSASRGGDVTYHGPGQLVGYPVLRIDRGVVGHLRAMADGLIEVLAGLGIAAIWRREAPGLWVTTAQGDAKICSFGVHVHRRVAIHGFALNVSVNLDAFRLIVPCGLPGVVMTSIDRLVGGGSSSRTPTPTPTPTPRSLTPESLANDVAAALGRSFARDFIRIDPAQLLAAD
jgi:lipoyl(octanoyl) transferase